MLKPIMIIIICDPEFYWGRPVGYGKYGTLHFGSSNLCIQPGVDGRGGSGHAPPQTMDKKIKLLLHYAYRRAGSRHGSVTLNDHKTAHKHSSFARFQAYDDTKKCSTPQSLLLNQPLHPTAHVMLFQHWRSFLLSASRCLTRFYTRLYVCDYMLIVFTVLWHVQWD